MPAEFGLAGVSIRTTASNERPSAVVRGAPRPDMRAA